MMKYLQINRGRIVSMWGENNGENGHDGQQFEQITVQYIPGIDSEAIPPGSTVIIDSGMAAVFRELLKECVVLKPDKFRGPSRNTVNISELLTSPDVIDRENGLTVKNYLMGLAQRDWETVWHCLAENMTFYSNTMYWTTERGEMRANNRAEFIPWLVGWRSTLPIVDYELSVVSVTSSMAFIQYQLQVVTEEGDRVSIVGDDGKLLANALDWYTEAQKSDLDHLRNAFIDKVNQDRKPKTYNYIDGVQQAIDQRPPVIFELTEQTLAPMTIYYRFNDRHQITEIRHIMEADPAPLTPNILQISE